VAGVQQDESGGIGGWHAASALWAHEVSG